MAAEPPPPTTTSLALLANLSLCMAAVMANFVLIFVGIICGEMISWVEFEKGITPESFVALSSAIEPTIPN